MTQKGRSTELGGAIQQRVEEYLFVTTVFTPDVANRNSLPCSGPTRRSGIDLIRQVGGTPSSGAVNPTKDGSLLNAEVTATSA